MTSTSKNETGAKPKTPDTLSFLIGIAQLIALLIILYGFYGLYVNNKDLTNFMTYYVMNVVGLFLLFDVIKLRRRKL